MIKLMIIEDEYLQRELLKNVVNWSQYDTQIVCEADNSDDAIMLAERHQPDVIFLDIVIHGENGIQTAKKIREKVKHCQIIVTTAYGTFDFARDAIYAGVCGYLLKPINPDELLPLFMSASEKALYDKTKAAHEKDLQLQKQLFEMLSGVGELSAEQKRELGLDRGGFLNAIYVRFTESLSDDSADIMEQIIDHCNLSYPDGICLRASNAVLLFLIGLSDDFVAFDLEASVFAEDVHALLQDRNIPCLIERSESYPSVQDIRAAFQDACNKLKITEQLGEENYSTDYSRILYAHISELRDVFNMPHTQMNFDKSKSLLQALITETMSAPLHWSEKQHLIDHVFSMLLETRTRNNCQPSAQEISKVRQILDDMNKKTDRSYIETELIMISQELLSSFEAVYNSPSQKKVHAAQQYISSHYSDPNLTLREVAEAVEASPCYLSNIFKVEAGITFSNYLTQLRLLNAKEAIEKKQNKPLYQIAEESGYYDYYYFCRRFRQYFGVSPSNV